MWKFSSGKPVENVITSLPNLYCMNLEVCRKKVENGEIGSTQGNGWMHKSIADALGEDETDVVISHEPVYQK